MINSYLSPVISPQLERSEIPISAAVRDTVLSSLFSALAKPKTGNRKVSQNLLNGQL